MNGLEITELSWSKVFSENQAHRIDSEFFRKAALNADQVIRSHKWAYLNDLASRIESFGAYSLCNQIAYIESGIPYLRCVNIKQGVVDFNDALQIDEEANRLLWKSEIKPGMVLLTMSGSVGNAAVALDAWKYPINSNQDIAKISTTELNPFYLVAFFSSQIGQDSLLRHPVGSVQQHIFLWQIEHLPIPIPSDAFQRKVEANIREAHALLESSRTIYQTAQDLLLREITVADWKSADPQTTTHSFKEACAAKRLDAEHFQQRYWAVRERCTEYAGGYKLLGDLTTSITNGVESREFVEEGVPYLRVGDMRKLRIDSQSPVLIPKAEAETLKSKIELKSGDVLISRSGSLGQAAVVTPEHIDSILSSHLMRIRLKPNSKIQPTYFALFMATLPGVQQVLMHSNGGVVPEISQPNLKLVVVPNLKTKVQDRIAQLIEESHETENSAGVLLDRAKEAVDIAVRLGEANAMEYLSRKPA